MGALPHRCRLRKRRSNDKRVSIFMDGRTDIVGVVTVPIASPDGGSGVALVLVPLSGVVCCSTGMGNIALHFGVAILG